MAPSRPEQHATDRRAQAILAEAMASWASNNPHTEDYGIDFTSEVFEQADGSMRTATGIDFQIQLKGTVEPRYSGTDICFSLDTAHLAHYVDNKRLPVFLVLVDVNARKGFYSFLQDRDLSLPNDWRSQQTVTIRIPQDNSIHDSAGFEQAVRSADKRMATLRAGALESAMAAEKQKLETLDPRIEVDITATTNGTHVTVRPREDITGTFHFEGVTGNVQEVLKRLIDRGEQVKPADFGVKVSLAGLPMTKAAKGAIQQLQIARKFPGEVRLSLVRSGTELGSLNIDGEWTAGTKEATLRASLPGSLFSVSANIQEAVDKGVPIHFEFAFDISSWVGADASVGLKYFDKLHRFLGDARDGDLIRFELNIEGNFLGADVSPFESLSWAKRIASILSILHKLRYICQRTKSSINMSELTPTNIAEIEFAHDFLSGKEVSITMSPGTISTGGGKMAFPVGHVTVCRVDAFQASFFCDVLGHRLDCGPALVVCEKAEITATSVSLRDDGYHIDWVFSPQGRAFALIQDPNTPTMPQTNATIA